FQRGAYTAFMSTATTTPKKPAFQPPAPSPVDAATQKVAQRLAELCDKGKYEEAMKELYADNARHVEAMEMPGCPRTIEGKANLLEKGAKFAKTTKVHSQSCTKPQTHGQQFT